MSPNKNPVLQKDIMLYKKNKLAANLALLGLLCGCVYFVTLYAQIGHDNYFYKWSLGFDVVYNLFFMLFTFFFSEQVKNYKRNMFAFQVVVGVLQIGRACWLPLVGFINGALGVGTFLVMTIALGISGGTIIASAVIGYFRSKSLEQYQKDVEAGKIDLAGALKEEETAPAVEAEAKEVENA